MSHIRISEKHGVNPSLSICFLCQKEKNELMLLGRLPNDAEAPRKAVFNYEPCDECAEHMKKGVILISVKDGSDQKNPYRTGGWVVVTDEAVLRIFEHNAAQQMIKARAAFLEDSTWKQVGLPEMPGK